MWGGCMVDPSGPRPIISSDGGQDQNAKFRANLSMHSQDNARKPIGRTVVYGEIESILAYKASCDAIQLDILLRVL